MAGEGEIILKVLGPIKSIVYDSIRNYVSYIGSCEDNLHALHGCLKEVCDKKDDIKKKVKVGNDKQEEITREAMSWLHDVQMLVNEENVKELMYKDIDTAKYVVKIMGKKSLKKRISKENEMQEVVVKVMKKLKEEMEDSEEEEITRKTREADYKHVAEVVVEVTRNTVEEFKKLMQEDKKMAIMALRTLKGADLDKLTKDDQEMEEIFRKAVNATDEDEQWQDHDDDEEFNLQQPLLVKIPTVDGRNNNNNKVKEAVKKLFTPLGKLMDDADFKKVMPEAGGVKLGLDVIDGLVLRSHGLKKETDNTTKQHRGGCCGSFSLCEDYHGRYQMSRKAESIVNHIQVDIINRCPQGPITLPIRVVDMKQIPTQFFKGLVSRTKMVDQIVEKLNDHKVYAVGVFGMGGAGKTTLAKEVSLRAKDAFAIKVMVEISDAPDFVRIQATIAESIGLPLHDIQSVSERAIKLYNKLSDVKKEKKILIILDNVWKKLNLDEVGIPHTCKLLLTTRDKEVCRVMNVQDKNILEVGVMNTNEARELFKSLTGNQVDDREYKNVVERLLNKCGGLPLAIVATANSLKDKNLSSWVNFADDLEKPISTHQMSDDYHHAFTILNMSYKFIQPNGKRIFFLLASLFPLGSSASIESLLRYGIGLNLFEHVNKLSEAMDKAVKWVDELTLSSMLLEGDGKGDVKIHDVVRDFAISYAAKEDGHEFMVEAIPRWLDDETLNTYSAMSLTSKNDYSRLSGVEACKLQILILKGDLSPDFNDDFFSGIMNLKVLALSNMNFKPTLPGSIRKLKKLRTLCIEDSKLGNFELVGELENLLVLSLRGSSMENMPNEIGNLCKLRLLDLGGCISSKLPLIPTSVLNKLSTLEGLYMYNKWQAVLETEESGNEETNGIVNIRLPYLNALEIKEGDIDELPIDGQTIKNLDKFRISLGNTTPYINPERDFHNFCRSLYLGSIDASGCSKVSCLKLLLKKANYLEIDMSINFENVVPELDQEGFRSLISLHLHNWLDIKCIVDGHTMNNMIVFPGLESLRLRNLESLGKVCNGDVSPRSFSNLQTIQLSDLKELQYGLPHVPHNVKEIEVSFCRKLEFIFIENEEVLATELPFLKTLKLTALHQLSTLVGPKDFSASQGPRPFFGGKIGLPSLEFFELELCNNVGKLWGKEIHTLGFQNLKDIQIWNCVKLTSVGSLSVFSNLVQLENLSIRECDEMHEVISHEEIEESEIGDHSIIFPQLKSLTMRRLDNLKCFYGRRSKLEFPKLEKLNLDRLKSTKMFTKLENSSALFSEKIKFPCLEKLKVICVNDEVTELWDKLPLTTNSNPAPMLRQLALGSSTGLLQIPSIVLKNLVSLKLPNFHLQDSDAVFSASNLGAKGEFVWTYSQLPKLEGLKVWGSDSLKKLFEEKDYNPVDDALMSFCGQFKTLELKLLPSLNLIPLHLFKSIASLTLSKLKWNYLISAEALNSLHQLQLLSISDCDNMEALVINVGSQINLPSLKELYLFNLGSFIDISSMPKNEDTLLLPSLESLLIKDCPILEHFWQGSISAPRLQDVDIHCCDNLQHLLVGYLVDTIELPSLRKVAFRFCDNLKSISTGSLTTPKLSEVSLYLCPKMKYFFPENQNHDGDLQLPSLEIVEIDACHNFHAFSLGLIVAPKLTQIDYDEKEYSMLPYNDLNHFLKEKYDLEHGDNDNDDDDISEDENINEDDGDDVNED